MVLVAPTYREQPFIERPLYRCFLRNDHLPYLLKNVLFFSQWVFYQEHSRLIGQQGKEEAISFNTSLLLPPASQTLRHYPASAAESSPLYIASSGNHTLKCN